MPRATHSHSNTLPTLSPSSYCTLVANQTHSFGSLLLISSSPLLPSLPQVGLMPIPTALLPPSSSSSSSSSSRMIPYESTISAAPLSRKTLLQTLPLAMNLSLNVGGTSPQENDDINSTPLALGGWLVLRALQLHSELDDVFWTSDGKAAVLLASLHSNKDSDKTPEEEGIRSSHYHEWDRD